ncbi:MAG TPA: murein biosynthesis integral membrane protein MurJ [Acidimicrobiales bacterium]|nr:murein biosynthesis integral membrane protein MurJ [Acidimicrobiales bacterium]
MSRRRRIATRSAAPPFLRPRRPIGSLARGAAAVAMVALAIVGATPRRAGAQSAGNSQLRVTDQTTWISNSGTFRLGLTVTTPDPTSARLQLSIYQPLTSRSDFTESLADRIHTARRAAFNPVNLTSLGASPALTLAVNSKPSDHAAQSIKLTTSGVYPVRVDLVDGAGNLVSRLTTHLVYSGADAVTASRLDVAWVVPFHAPPAVASPSSALAAGSDAAGLVALAGALAQHPSVPLTVDATPQTVEALAGGTAPDRAAVEQLASALGNSNRQLLASPYVRLDLPATLAAGLDTEVTAQLATGNDILAADLHATPMGAAWVEEGPLSAAAVDELAGRGVQRLVVADKSLTPLPADERVRTLAQPFTVAGRSAHIAGGAVDAGLSAHFTAAPDEMLAAHQFLAELAMVQLELPNRRGGRGVVVVPPLDWHPNAGFLATVLDGLASAPMLAPVTVDRFFSDVTPLASSAGTQSNGGSLVRNVAPPDQQPKSEPIADTGAIRAIRRVAGSLATIVPASSPAVGEINRHVLISESADTPERSRPAELAAATSLINRLKAMVHLPGNQSITFTARQGLIPVTILSSASYPLKIRVRVTSQKLGFQPVQLVGGACTNSATSEVCTIQLRAQNTTVRVPVVAKTAGVFSLTVALDSPDGAINLATNQDTVRSTAASGVGVVLSLGAALLLMVWWLRDVVHGRRAKRLMPKRFGELSLVGADADATRPVQRPVPPPGAFPPPRRPPPTPVPAPPPAGRPAQAPTPGPAPPRAHTPTPAPAPTQPPAPTPVPVPSPRQPSASVASPSRPRPASWDDQTGTATQPIPIVIADLPSEPPQLSIAPPPRPRPPSAPAHFRTPQKRRADPTRLLPTRSATRATTATRPTTATTATTPPAEADEAQEAAAFSRNTAVMAAGTLLSRLTGFARVLALIWAFGIGSGLTDVYNIANTAPNILYDLVLGGVLSATLVPVFVDYLGRDDGEEGWQAVSAVVTAIAVVLVALSALFWLATPAIIRFYEVLNHTAAAGDERVIGTNLLHMFVPQLFLLGGIAVTTALLNARRRFMATAFSPVVNNVVAVAAIVGARLVATNLTLPGLRRDQSALLILGLGTTAGYLFQFLVQVPPMMRAGIRLRPMWDLAHPAVRTVLRLSLWTFGSVVANQVSFNLILVLADHRKGDVTVFTTAYQFFQLPYAIFAVSIAAVITPDLSEQWARRSLDGFRRQMAQGFRLTMAVLVPAAVGYVALAQPFLRLVLNHGSFSAGDAHRIAVVVALFAVGLPGFSAYLLLMRAYQAMQDTRSMFWLYLVENAATIVLAVALYPLMGVEGLALGWVGAYTVGSIAAFAHLRRRTGGLDGQAIVASLARVAAATALMLLPVLAISHLVPSRSTPELVLMVGGGVVAGTAMYLAAARAFGVTELATLLRRERPA